jgi:hypothetical protein
MRTLICTWPGCRGEWLNVKALTLTDDSGLAVTWVEIGDADGQAGWSRQSLVIEPRPVAGTAD